MQLMTRARMARRTPVLAVLCALLAAALVVAPSAFADPFGTQTQLSDSGSLEDSSLDAEDAQAAYGMGRTLVVWEQDLPVPESESIYKRIYGRFVDGNGAPLGAPFAITARPGGDDVEEEFPDVAYDALHDQFLVVFSDDEEEFIGAQRIAADGSRVGDLITIHDLDGRQTRVAWSSATDRFLVVFDAGSTIKGRLVDPNGVPMGAEPTTVGTGEVPGDPDVAYDPISDRWLVVFTDFNGVFGTLVDRDLGLVGDTLTIAQDKGTSSGDPAVAGSAIDGGFRVAFVSNEELFFRGAVDAPSLVLVQAVDRTGALSGEPVAASNGGEDLELSNPAITHDSRANEFLVTWEQERQSGPSRALEQGEREIFGQRLSVASAQLGTDDAQVSSHPEGATKGSYGGEDPAVAYDASTCTYVAAWEGDVTPDGKEEVFDRPWDAPDCPSSPAVVEQAPAQAQAPSTQAARRPCTSRRAFRIRLVRHRGIRYRSAVVRVNGKKVEVLRGARLRAPVVLTGLPKGRFTVSITATTTKGKKMRAVRRYRTCERKRPPSNRLGRKGSL